MGNCLLFVFYDQNTGTGIHWKYVAYIRTNSSDQISSICACHCQRVCFSLLKSRLQKYQWISNIHQWILLFPLFFRSVRFACNVVISWIAANEASTRNPKESWPQQSHEAQVQSILNSEHCLFSYANALFFLTCVVLDWSNSISTDGD